MSAVGIDAMVLVYAGIVPSKDAPRSSLSDLQVRAKCLLYQLFDQKATIILPVVAISELLVPVPPSDAGALIKALTERFVCPTFDLQAAAIAANLWAAHKKLPRDQQYSNRHILKVDALIVASAKAAGAIDFYSNDRHCRTLAATLMNAHELPTKPTSLKDIFLESDIRRGDL